MSTLEEQRSEEESYFVSMTDMMVGLLFLFIIMLMNFAFRLQETTEDLTSANEVRSEILQDIQKPEEHPIYRPPKLRKTTTKKHDY